MDRIRHGSWRIGKTPVVVDYNESGSPAESAIYNIAEKAGAKRIAQTLNRFCSGRDVEKYASQLIFAIAIGNLDMHAKNVSVIHLPDETIMLAPTYDQVPLRHQNTDGRLALSVGGEYVHEKLTLADIAAELTSWQYSGFSSEEKANAFIKRCLECYLNILDNTKPVENAYPGLKADISSYISNLLAGKSIGKTT